MTSSMLSYGYAEGVKHLTAQGPRKIFDSRCTLRPFLLVFNTKLPHLVHNILIRVQTYKGPNFLPWKHLAHKKLITYSVLTYQPQTLP